MSDIKNEQCGVCGRKLKSPKSQELGFGPSCYRKYLAEKAVEENQSADKEG